MGSEGEVPAADEERARAAPQSPGVASAGGSARKRLPLGATPRRLSFERRLRLWLAGLAVPIVGGAGWLAWETTGSRGWAIACALLAATVSALVMAALFEQITRPLQTLSNVVAALREDDFSFRARGARRGDSLGDLALEINALAATLQGQRTAARDALSLAERVMNAMRTPVLAFAADGTLRLLNPAAEQSFALSRATALGQAAEAAGVARLPALSDGEVYTHPAAPGSSGETRWVVRRSGFRLGGVPHILIVLSDVDAVLREEERVAWQRLVRVLSHEINNSLTPIASIAGSLQGRLPPPQDAAGQMVLPAEAAATLARGLRLIEDRAYSLHRFVHAYQRLTRMPRPTLQRVALDELVARAVALEDRARIDVEPGPMATIDVDPGQMEQLLINLLRNAAEAALSLEAETHHALVQVGWTITARELVLSVRDNGPGLSESANLFVPFYTTKPGGNGIGLVLAQQIAQAHGGTLALMNGKDGTGCVAELTLPRQGSFRAGEQGSAGA